MRKSKTLQRLRSGQVVRTALLGHYIPGFVYHSAQSSYDCIWLDLEHRALTTRELQALLSYSHQYDVDMMVRPPTIGKTALYRYLEEGATGLLVPQVSTPERAKELVAAAKFPPVGDRGIDNAGLDADFNIHDPDDYVQWANRETFLAVQIETPQAVRDAEAIAAVEGIDLIFVGPGDLGLRLRNTGEMSLEDAFERIATACANQGKPWGCPAFIPEEFTKRREQGAQLLVAANEFRGWRDELRNGIACCNGVD